MRCKKHLSDFSSTIGVCACCLRERLSSVIEFQYQLKSISDNPNPNSNSTYCNVVHHHHQQKQHCQNQPPPLIFPRSVSPYISRRKSDQTAAVTVTNKPIIQRFYSTPQVGPTYQKKKSAGKFSLISKLFRSKSSVYSTSNSGVGHDELTRPSNRGMSPQNEWEQELGRENESPVSRVMTTRPSPGRVKASPARIANNLSSLALCLSPLVRASPARRFNWGVDSSLSGEIRVPVTGKNIGGNCCSNNLNNNNNNNNNNPQLADAASFCANRSRKIADFGRLNRKR